MTSGHVRPARPSGSSSATTFEFLAECWKLVALHHDIHFPSFSFLSIASGSCDGLHYAHWLFFFPRERVELERWRPRDPLPGGCRSSTVCRVAASGRKVAAGSFPWEPALFSAYFFGTCLSWRKFCLAARVFYFLVVVLSLGLCLCV